MVVVELQRWGIDGRDKLVDPGLILLQLVAQSADRVRLYSQLLADAYQITAKEPEGDLDRLMKGGGHAAALIGYRYGVDREGNRFPVEEAIRGLVQLEMAERKFCGDLATKAIAAGLAERQVRLAEQHGTLIVLAIRGIIDDLQLTPEQLSRSGEIVSRRLREITIDGELV